MRAAIEVMKGMTMLGWISILLSGVMMNRVRSLPVLSMPPIPEGPIRQLLRFATYYLMVEFFWDSF